MPGLNRDSLHKVLVVGVGSIGERHVRCFQKTGRASVSICELNQFLRSEVARRYEVESQFGDLDEAIVDSYDAAVIAVPANLHISIAQKLVDAGLHLLIEKPLSVSMDGVRALVEAVSQKKRVAAVGYVNRAHPSLSAMKAAIESGEFGKPLQIVVVAGQHFPTYRPAFRDTYYASHANGGGAIQDAMTHLVNAGEWLLGPVDRVVADGDHMNLDGVQVEDVVHVLARHGTVLGSYSLNQFQSPNELTMTVVCERGTARCELHRHRWRQMMRPDEPWHDVAAPGVERDTLFVRQAEVFLSAIEHELPPLCSLEEGVQTLRVNLAILKSLECGQWQRVA